MGYAAYLLVLVLGAMAIGFGTAAYGYGPEVAAIGSALWWFLFTSVYRGHL